ncbi:MAG TPA: hypothetical protein VGP28_00825 [Methylocella sp.]|nr:hypothetical protein [Methylocella sp.]
MVFLPRKVFGGLGERPQRQRAAFLFVAIEPEMLLPNLRVTRAVRISRAAKMPMIAPWAVPNLKVLETPCFGIDATRSTIARPGAICRMRAASVAQSTIPAATGISSAMTRSGASGQ